MTRLTLEDLRLQPAVDLYGVPVKFEILAANVPHVLGLSAQATLEHDLALLQLALTELRQHWHRRHPALGLSWNMWPEFLKQPGFGRRLIDLMRSSGLPMGLLTAEITENQGLDLADPAVLTNVMDISRSGIKLALDDVGSGHFTDYQMVRAICATLRQRGIRLSALKLDRSLIEAIGTSGGLAEVRQFIQLADGFGAITVAEGANDDEHVGRAIEQGCLQFQSFRFGRKMSVAECIEWLERRRRPLAVLLSRSH